jgi:hypothetical protein
MATCTLQKITGTGDRKGKHSVTHTYLYLGDSVIENPLDAIAQAQSTGPRPAPGYGAQLTNYFMFCQTIQADHTSERRDSWLINATFGVPESGEDEEQQEQPNPLNRPPVYDIQYIEQEYVIEQAKNVEALTGGGATRAANTLGPIENAAKRRPDEPIVDTERNAVVVIEKNYATLGAIMALNETYKRTCNSDSCNVGGQSISARRLKYMVTRSLGRQQEGDIVYYPGVTEIELKKTTDLMVDNVGYEYWDVANSKHVRAKDGDGEHAADPVNLKLDGDLNTGAKTTITYRHLEEVAYASFFS